ncbi:NADPH-dependent FMN reductase [Nonomuraea sp. NPDC051941]|uniref:NADPH-dependent FMN reductase n=1 Tax=Nonomuraea sp. NPDC051941 TaxID=3364373 RepID=UPI0037C81097
MIRIAIILGSTRPGRRVEDVARWVAEAAGRHPAVKTGEAGLELVDIAEYELPLLDEPAPAVIGYYQNAHTKRWAATIDRFDGFVFVTPEYNSAIPAALKNAIDYLYAEWNEKQPGSSATGFTAAPAPPNNYGRPWARSKSPTYTPRSRSTRTSTSTSPNPKPASAPPANARKPP